jgi:hypothetical protein
LSEIEISLPVAEDASDLNQPYDNSNEYCFRVARRMSLTTCSDKPLPASDFCLISAAPKSYDEPEIPRSSSRHICLIGADAGRLDAGQKSKLVRAMNCHIDQTSKRGIVTVYSPVVDAGLIRGEDGRQYVFDRDHWHSPDETPRDGLRVSFTADRRRPLRVVVPPENIR